MFRPATLEDEINPPRRTPRLFVVSPHLDDAVLGCASLLVRRGGAVVCTVFTGEPEQPAHTEWDKASGFADSREAMRARRAEDDRALALYAAEPVRLGFLDAQYGARPSVAAVAEALADQLGRLPGCMLVCPLGLWHTDHELVGAACRALLRDGRVRRCVAYEDAIYRAIPGALEAGLARLERDGLRACSLSVPTVAMRHAASLKLRAVNAYASQLRAFGPFPIDVARAERYWRLESA